MSAVDLFLTHPSKVRYGWAPVHLLLAALGSQVVMRARCASACLILGAMALFAPLPIQAQSTANQQDTNSQGQQRLHVSGTIVSQAGGPVKKSVVRLVLADPPVDQRPTVYSETTDEAGKFTIQDVLPGDYFLQATKTGFLPGIYGARTPSAPGAIVSVPDGNNVEGLEIKLVPQGLISGRVTNVDGDPVPHASVGLGHTIYQNGKKRTAKTFTRADSLGNYTFSNVSPGRYTVGAQSMENPPGLEPGMSDMASSAPLFTVGSGETVEGIDVKLRRGKLYSVKGKVTFNGKLVTTPMGITVTNPPPATGGSWTCMVRDGLFTMIDQSPGPHLMEMLGGNGGMGANGLVGKMTFNIVDSNVDDVVFELQQATPIQGVLTMEGKDWQSQFSLGGVSSGTATGMAATPASTGAAASGAPPVIPPMIVLTATDSNNARSTGRADETGAFTLTPTVSGTYFVEVSGLPKGAYVKNVHYGFTDTSQGLQLGSGGESLAIDISLKTATISGVLTNEKGEPLSGYIVSAWPGSPNPLSPTHGVKTALSNQQGSFRITGLAPGKYHVAAFEEIEPGLRQFPDFLMRFEDRAESVELSEGLPSNVSVKPILKEASDAEFAKLP